MGAEFPTGCLLDAACITSYYFLEICTFRSDVMYFSCIHNKKNITFHIAYSVIMNRPDRLFTLLKGKGLHIRQRHMIGFSMFLTTTFT